MVDKHLPFIILSMYSVIYKSSRYFRLQLTYLNLECDKYEPFPSLDDTPSVDLSIVIPAYNESKRLPVFLDVLFPYMAKVDYTYEIIVVDDGSRDETVEVVHGYSKKHGSNIIRFVGSGGGSGGT